MSDYNHPTQEMGDAITIKEHLPEGKKMEDLKVVFVGDATQVCASLMMLTTKLGMDFVQFGPKGFSLRRISEDRGGKLQGFRRFVPDYGGRGRSNEKCGFRLYGRMVWVVRSGAFKEDRMRIFYPKFQVSEAMLSKASPDVKFMHCLPATRGEEVTDEVLDGPRSIVIDEAENRLTAMRSCSFISCIRKNPSILPSVTLPRPDSEAYMKEKGLI